ncbi:MAG: hypothetical protein NTX01_04055 [Candidatus Omnitrophica bacterium]|nr:hypothetical protein [Candidatus Omnitrophota bacterium]
MKKLKKASYIFLFFCVCLMSSQLLMQAAFGQETASFFEKGANYDIYYQSSDNQVDCIKNVKIVGSEQMFGVTFLRVHTSGAAQPIDAFIVFSGIRAIVPNGQVISQVRI